MTTLLAVVVVVLVVLAVFQARSADEARKMVAEAGLTGDTF